MGSSPILVPTWPSADPELLFRLWLMEAASSPWHMEMTLSLATDSCMTHAQTIMPATLCKRNVRMRRQCAAGHVW